MANVPGPALELTDDGVPLLYSRAWAIYDHMLANLSETTYEGYRLYKGKITEEVQAAFGITPSQYSRAMGILKEADAVELVDRSNAGSHWVLYYRPTIEEFEQSREAKYKSRRKPTKQEIVDQRLHDLTVVISDLQQRVAKLEKENRIG